MHLDEETYQKVIDFLCIECAQISRVIGSFMCVFILFLWCGLLVSIAGKNDDTIEFVKNVNSYEL